MGLRYPHQGTTKDGSGKVICSATVAVFLTGTSTPASIYAASAGGVAVNSVTSGANTSSTPGYFIFWVDRSDYAASQEFDITISKSGFGTQTYSFITIDNGADYALTDHKASHENGGAYEISVTGLSGLLADDQHVLDAEVVIAAKTVKLDDFTAPDDNTDLNVSASAHGLFPKWIDDTVMDVSIAKHGLCPKAPNDTTKFLRGDATFEVTPLPFPTPTDQTASRAIATVYQNTSGKTMFVTVGITLGTSSANLGAYIGSANPPTILCENVSANNTIMSMSFVVPNNYYYRLNYISGSGSSINVWLELV